MTRRLPTSLLSIAVAGSLAVAGCGSGGGSSATSSGAQPGTPSGHAATLNVASQGSLGKILVDSKGRTLYLFQKDAGTKSACTGACAAEWPPLRASGKPVAGTGLSASKTSTTARSDGGPEVTYNGHPLYLFAGDQKPGDTNGQGITAFGGGWFALTPAGTTVSGSGSGGGGNGY
jgi:predicted lipoprotein with Yx(FWY)xxD motif